MVANDLDPSAVDGAMRRRSRRRGVKRARGRRERAGVAGVGGGEGGLLPKNSRCLRFRCVVFCLMWEFFSFFGTLLFGEPGCFLFY